MLVLIAVASGACKLPRGTIPKYVHILMSMHESSNNSPYAIRQVECAIITSSLGSLSCN